MALNDAFSAGQVLTASEMNNLPFGVVERTERTAGNVNITTTLADLTGMSLTFTAVSTRIYKISWHLFILNNTSAHSTFIYLTDGSNNIKTVSGQYAASGLRASAAGFWFTSGISGSTTYKLRGAATADTSTMSGTSGESAVFMIEDIGLA